jgi:hypothetical protein
MPNWEEFTDRGTRSASDPAITFQRAGVISLNVAAHEALGQPEAVVFLFDRDEQLLGIRAATRDIAHAYRLRKPVSGDHWLVSAKALMQKHGLGVEHATRYAAEMLGDVLAVDLKGKGTVVRKTRNQRGSRADREPTPLSVRGAA